jgi:hypothetical protein
VSGARTSWFIAGALLLLATACRTGTDTDPGLNKLKARASFDLNCPRESLRIQTLDEQGHLQGVEGCGARATYVWSCRTTTGQGWGAEDDCKWVMNSSGSNR